MTKKKFKVQVRLKNNTNRHKAGEWVDYKAVWPPWQKRKKDRWNYRIAKRLTGKLAKNRGVKNVRMRMVRPPVSKKEAEQKLIAKWLCGDLDGTHDLMLRLARVAAELGHTLYVAEAKRSIAEQWRLWKLKLAGVIKWPVAYPGTSRHTWGKAADVRRHVQRGTANIGEIEGARAAMTKHGLCLPVPGEPWHVEIGTTWRA